MHGKKKEKQEETPDFKENTVLQVSEYLDDLKRTQDVPGSNPAERGKYFCVPSSSTYSTLF